jgi:hypothetical protein
MGNRNKQMPGEIHRLEDAAGSAFLVNPGGDYVTASVVPVAPVGGAPKLSAAIIISRGRGTVAMALWVGSDLVEAKHTHQNHSHQWGCQEKGLPTGLKGYTLHADPPGLIP